MKIAVLSSHTSSLFWFRIDMMKEFIRNGHSVVALGSEPEYGWSDKFNQYGIEYRQIKVERNGINPLKDFLTLISIYKFLRKERPDKVFAYQAKTVIYGSIAARLNGISNVYLLIAGLGSIFRGKGLKNNILKVIMKMQYRFACICSEKVFFQNNDDKNEFVQNSLVKENKTVIINGSGVDIEKFKPTPLPNNASFLFIGRLIKDKGIMEYLEACKEIKLKYPSVRCLLVGPFDTNPSALKREELDQFINDGIVEYFGEQQDVRPFIVQCTTFVLPSYHEGTPKTVLEAMAIGRSVITSDAPGCRETVVDGLNGYLVKIRDISGLVRKMEHLILHPDINRIMGVESAKIARVKYDVRIVNKTIIQTMGLI